MSGALIARQGPVSVDEFAGLLEKFLPLSPKIAIGVSGGPDSMALAFLLKRWAQSEVIAFIVDHGLRPGSATEAAQVKSRLENIGVTGEILRWQHDDITAGLHERARQARYELLTSACRRHGAGDLWVAHHRDDQAETILMRLAKGSGVEGLAGMAARTWRDNVRILRPFLALPKERLIATCEAEKIPFVTDPSNGSEKFARGRLRKILPLLAEEGMTVDSLIALGARAGEAAGALDHYTKTLLCDAAHVEIGGAVHMDRAALREVPRAIGLRALAACLIYVHNGDYPPEPESLSSLFDAIIDAENETARTFYGCILSIAKNRILILREPAAAIETLPLSPGQTILWDKRWLITAEKSFPVSGAIGALGNPPHALIDRLAPAWRHKIPQGRVRASLPALWVDGKIYAIPSFDEKAALRLIYRKGTFP